MIHVAIDARLPDKGQGGVQQVIRSLAEGFQLIENSDVKRSWIFYKGTEWWEGVFPQEDNLIVINPPFGKISIFVANKAPRLLSLIYPILSIFKSQKPPFDDQLSALCVDVVHMPFQDGFVTKLPYIYHPHDLQHEYFPEYFSRSQRNHRNTTWKKLATEAKIVMAASVFVKNDLMNFWGIPIEKIRVIPVPPPTRTFNTQTINPYRELSYCIYPAVFWPHKNHFVLVHAIKKLLLSTPSAKCVFAGSSGSEEKKVRKLVRRLGLSDSIYFIGHVPESHYGPILRDSKTVVIPSLFEAMSLTVMDALMLGKSVVCSDIDAFKLHESKNVVFFDPKSSSDLASKLEAVFDCESYEDQWTHANYSKQNEKVVSNYVNFIERIYIEIV
jgi:glycosyltransferase involved in cell wall biosynthesis